MDGVFARGPHAAWAQCWQVTLLILGVWLMVRLFARNRPHLASVLWLVVLIKCVTPPVWSSPSSIFSWLESQPVSNPSDSMAPRWKLIKQAGLEPATRVPPARSDVVVQISRTNAQSGDSSPEVSPATWWPSLLAGITSRLNFGGSATWTGWLVVLWFAGYIGFTCLAALRCARCWRRLHEAGQIEAPQIIELTEKLRRRVGLRHPVRVLISRSKVGPAVIGLWRPTVVLPAILVESKTLRELEPLLAHELIHIRRGDLWLGLLQLVTRGVWWFHPLVRMANGLLTRETERCCDEEVIALLGCEPGQYARGLLDVLALKRMLQPIPEFPGVRPVDVTSQRLERIMKLGQGCHKRTPRWCWAVMLLAVAATLPGAAFVAAEGEPRPVTDKVPDLAAGSETKTTTDTPPAEKVLILTEDVQYISGDEPAEQLAGTTGFTRVYLAVDILERLKTDTAADDAHARQTLIDMVKQAAQPPAARNTASKPLKASRRTWNEAVPPGRTEVVWKDTLLVIKSSQEGHERVTNRLAAMREDGFRQLMIETRIMTGDLAGVKNIPSDWKFLNLRTMPSTDLLATELPAEDAGLLPDPQGNPFQGRIEAVVQDHRLARLGLVPPALIEMYLQQAQKDSRTNLLWAPKILLFNGQTATVQDQVQRSFVTSIQRTADGYSSVVRKLDEGWSLWCRPKLQSKDQAVHLDLHFTLNEIRRVESSPAPDAQDLPGAVIQIPDLATIRIRTQVDMPLDQTLVITGLNDLTPSGSEKTIRQPLMVLVHVQAVPIEGRQNSSNITSAPTQSDSVVKVSATANADAQQVKPANQLTVELQATPKVSEPTTRANVEPMQVTRVYSVADLVIPLPTGPAIFVEEAREVRPSVEARTGIAPRNPVALLNLKGAPNSAAAIPTQDQVDFEGLTDLIVNTIAPDSWAERGGLGAIRGSLKTLSLVVRQTESNHRAIDDLIEQLRRLQNLQASYHLERLEVNQPELEAWAANEPREISEKVLRTFEDAPGSVISIGSREAYLLRKAGGVSVRSGPKVTLFNAQSIELQLAKSTTGMVPEVPWLRLNPVLSADLRAIRVDVTAGVSSSDEKVTSSNTESITMPRGQSLLIDLSEQSWSNRITGVPVLEKIPHPSKLFKNTNAVPASATRQFYLVTPRIMIVQPKVESLETSDNK